jgi:hypothetical protein
MRLLKPAALLILTIVFPAGLPAQEKADALPKKAAGPAAQEKEEPAKATKFNHPVTFTFVDEKGAPVKGSFTIHECKNGEFKRNIRRNVPLDDKGSVTVDAFPAEFEFDALSRDEFYYFEGKSSELDPAKHEFRKVCMPKGAIHFEVQDLPGPDVSMVMEFQRKTEKGTFEIVRGIGLSAKTGKKQTMGDLEPGDYYIAVKFHYEDSAPLFKSKEFKVVKKEYTELPAIKITEEDIARSKK